MSYSPSTAPCPLAYPCIHTQGRASRLSNRTYRPRHLTELRSSMYLPGVQAYFHRKKFAQNFKLVLEVKEERQLACIAEAARSKGYTRPTWTSESLLLQTWFFFASFFCRSENKEFTKRSRRSCPGYFLLRGFQTPESNLLRTGYGVPALIYF